MHSYIIIDSIMYSKPLTFYVMRLSYFSNDKKSLSQQLFRFGKLFRKVVSESTFLFRKVVSESTFDFGKCENAFPNHLPKQLSQKTFHVWHGLKESTYGTYLHTVPGTNKQQTIKFKLR